MITAITGANGHLGVRLIASIDDRSLLVALVRSKSAAEKLEARFPGLKVRLVNYTDPESLATGLQGCQSIIHLVGIIKETPQSSFVDAHENSIQSLVTAAGEVGVQQIVYLSLLGADPASNNACFRSRGRAEDLLRAAGLPALVLRIPMVLGEGDYASAALKRNATKSLAFTFRATSLEQPIYAGDVIRAMQSALDLKLEGTLDLAGPESLSRRALIQRAAGRLGNAVRIVSLPLGIGMLLARGLALLPKPPVSRAMLGVLDHDDKIDVTEACARLNIKLTPLDETLDQVLV